MAFLPLAGLCRLCLFVETCARGLMWRTPLHTSHTYSEPLLVTWLVSMFLRDLEKRPASSQVFGVSVVGNFLDKREDGHSLFLTVCFIEFC